MKLFPSTQSQAPLKYFNIREEIILEKFMTNLIITKNHKHLPVMS